MVKDRIVEEVRRVRERYAARFNFDLDLIYRDLKKREEQGEFKVVHRTPRRVQPTARQGSGALRAGGSSDQDMPPTRNKARG